MPHHVDAIAPRPFVMWLGLAVALANIEEIYPNSLAVVEAAEWEGRSLGCRTWWNEVFHPNDASRTSGNDY